MKAVELVAPAQLRVVERTTPEPGPGEVRIAVSSVGICGTDMEFYRGRRSAGYPFVLGHECAGRIDAIGEGVSEWSIGTPVTVRPNFGCGRCEFCVDGKDNVCPDGRGLGVRIDGCLCEYFLAPARYVWPIPRGMDAKTAAMIEPAAVAERAVRRAGTIAGRRLLILGAGTIGLLALQIAAIGGAEVSVADPIAERRRWATDLGAYCALDPTTGELDGKRFDLVIETAGVPGAAEAAVEHAHSGGWIVLTGLPMDAARLETKWIVWRELKLVGSFIYDISDFARASERIASGELQASALVTDSYPLEHVGDAFRAVAEHRGLKTVIEIREEDW